jgi:hypothetical protein
MTTTVDRSACPAPRHGTETAYGAAGCRCRDAYAAFLDYRAALARGERRLIPSAGTVHRLRAMCVDGHRLKDLAAELRRDGAALQNLLARRRQVRTSTAWLVAELGAKLCGTPGGSSITSQRARAQWWLPWEAWQHGNIDDPAPVAVQDALIGWLNATDAPDSEYGPLAHLLARLDHLLPLPRAAMGRKAHALLARVGDSSPMVREAARVYDRDRARRCRGSRPDRWLAA